MDYRGREIQPLDEAEVRNSVNQIKEQGFSRVAVVSKFGQRNPSHELRIQEILREMYPDCKVELGHKVSGKLNFPRRVATSMLASATGERYQKFVAEIKKAMEERKIRAPVYILKADGGTLPIEKSVEFPVETIFSGPAASTIGALALTPEGQTSVVVDIGDNYRPCPHPFRKTAYRFQRCETREFPDPCPCFCSPLYSCGRGQYCEGQRNR
jgi:N-methylhydantoinase A/oxoprolinase/acetone carboxylase beta subunit